MDGPWAPPSPGRQGQDIGVQGLPKTAELNQVQIRASPTQEQWVVHCQHQALHRQTRLVSSVW